jgi:hypothetical protein
MIGYARHTACKGKIKNEHKSMVGNLDGRTHFGNIGVDRRITLEKGDFGLVFSGFVSVLVEIHARISRGKDRRGFLNMDSTHLTYTGAQQCN